MAFNKVIAISINAILFFQLCVGFAFRSRPHHLERVTLQRLSVTIEPLSVVEQAPYDDIIPFLSEHIQLSDQMLFVGAATDLAMQLSKNGYGVSKTGFIYVVDSNKDRIDVCTSKAKADKDLNRNMIDGKLSFQLADYTNVNQKLFDIFTFIYLP